VRVGVFGAARIARDVPEGQEPTWQEVGARKPRSVLAALAMYAGRPVSADVLADLVWAGEPPRAAHGALHAYISGVRKALDPERTSRSVDSVLATTDHGYVLRVEPGEVDVHRFVRDVRRIERLLAPLTTQLTTGDRAAWPGRGTVTAALDELDGALAAWTGTPYADLLEHPDVVAERAALEQVRTAAEQGRSLGLLALGEAASVLATTEMRVASHQLQERWWALHALALTRVGRQADALDALREVRELLSDELGLDPGPELRDLEQAILRQETWLVATLEPADGPVTGFRDGRRATSSTSEALGVGRVPERARLNEVLDSPAGSALLVGEPGIGKTWLTTQVADEAARRGFVVAKGACSQDDGAPPLWPWLGVLHTLQPGHDLGRLTEPKTDESAASQAFQTSDRIAKALLEVARAQPVLVILDDLHWADDATLRTLRHVLATTPADSRLAIVATRRTHPEPTGALAEVGEAFARRHAIRIDLDGLDGEEARALVRTVARAAVSDETVDAWHQRAAGNPFFLVELARLDEEDPTQVPATVRDVVTRRLATLDDRALDTLRMAAVAGRRFQALTVAGAAAHELDDVLDDLETARAAGLVNEEGAGDYAFAHALTRDSVYQSVPSTRRARMHAQVANTVESDAAVRRLLAADEVTAELARHWLAAGPSHVDRAWRAARAAADQARKVSAWQEALELRQAAVSSLRRSADHEEAALFELLLEVAHDAAYGARWTDVESACMEAITIGRMLGSPSKVAEAAAAMAAYCVWQPHAPEVVFEDVIDDLRWALAHDDVEDGDLATRCRLQLALAIELYYVPGTEAERQALMDTGMALAHRAGDPSLLWWASRAAWMAAWTPQLLEQRIAWINEGLAAAREVGDEAAQAVLLTSLAVDSLEAGRREDWLAASGEAMRLADKHRLPYVHLGLHWMLMCLASLSGDAGAVARHHRSLSETAPQVAVPMQHVHAPAAAMFASLWDPEALAAMADETLSALRDHYGTATTTHLLLSRTGRPDDVRRLLDQSPMPDEPLTYWSSLSDWADEAEAAAVSGHISLATQAVEVLRPYGGRIGVAGISAVHGPLDGYLSLALAAIGLPDEAAERADAALAQATEWGFTAYVEWLMAQRKRMAF
jgi:DNA-binding SARP family transcriptional activator